MSCPGSSTGEGAVDQRGGDTFDPGSEVPRTSNASSVASRPHSPYLRGAPRVFRSSGLIEVADEIRRRSKTGTSATTREAMQQCGLPAHFEAWNQRLRSRSRHRRRHTWYRGKQRSCRCGGDLWPARGGGTGDHVRRWLGRTHDALDASVPLRLTFCHASCTSCASAVSSALCVSHVVLFNRQYHCSVTRFVVGALGGPSNSNGIVSFLA